MKNVVKCVVISFCLLLVSLNEGLPDHIKYLDISVSVLIFIGCFAQHLERRDRQVSDKKRSNYKRFCELEYQTICPNIVIEDLVAAIENQVIVIEDSDIVAVVEDLATVINDQDIVVEDLVEQQKEKVKKEIPQLAFDMICKVGSYSDYTTALSLALISRKYHDEFLTLAFHIKDKSWVEDTDESYYTDKMQIGRFIMFMSDAGFDVNCDNASWIWRCVFTSHDYALFIKYGANIHHTYVDGKATPLMIAYDDTTQRLIDDGVDINIHGKAGMTALFTADEKKTRCLIEAGIDVNVRDNAGDTALTYSMESHVTKLLIDAGANVWNINNRQDLLIHTVRSELQLMYIWDEMKKDPEFNASIINQPNQRNNTPLYTAVNTSAGCRCIQKMIELGANVNAVSSSQRKPTPIFAANNIDSVEILYKNGADINMRNGYEQTALHVSRHYDVIKCLLKNGADVNVIDGDGNTVLHRHYDGMIVRLLLEAGADPSHVNNKGLLFFETRRNNDNKTMKQLYDQYS